MKNCSGCQHMRMKIPIIDGERKKGRLDYKGGIARCAKNHLKDESGSLRSFRLYRHSGSPKTWVEAIFCEDYAEANVAQELANLIIKAIGA